MLYFAYGSNMDWGQMRERCPSVRFIGVAKLPDHRLAFTRRSVKRDCGAADAVCQLGRAMWGVVFEIPDLEVGALDQSEGYLPGRDKNSYWRRECMVFLDSDEKRPLKVATYFAEPQKDPPLPNQDYKNLILAGARHWQLPPNYINELEGIAVSG